jgi:NTE family protein
MNFSHLAICLLLLSKLWSQEIAQAAPPSTQATRRPRIGLVLEGGGALGLAHVGVIKWLEENRIPVDVIAGSSMGALVGGTYASGETPDQIAHLIQSIKWHEVLRGVTPYRDLSFRRKEDRRDYPNAFEFGLASRLA